MKRIKCEENKQSNGQKQTDLHTLCLATHLLLKLVANVVVHDGRAPIHARIERPRTDMLADELAQLLSGGRSVQWALVDR